MSEELDTPVLSQPPEELPWFQVWVNALSRPSEATYVELVRDPKASSGRAYLWVFFTSLIGYMFIMLGQFVGLGWSAMFGNSPAMGSGEGGLLALTCQVPVAAVLSIISLTISAGITQLIAHALGGTGSFSKLVYAIAAYLAPLTLISGVLSVIPFVNLLSIPLGIYGIVLNVIAVKSVNQFGWGRAVLSSFIIFAFALVLVAVIVIAILALLGPAINGIFSNVVSGITTPVP
jgi:hypothetical protein